MNAKCYYLILVMVSFLAPNAFAQKLDTLKRKDGDGRYFIQIRSYGLVTEEGYLQNDIREGIWTRYWHTNFPKELITYRQGKKDGTYIGLTPAGNIELIEHYKSDKLEGPRRQYNGEGLLVEEALYSEGKKH